MINMSTAGAKKWQTVIKNDQSVDYRCQKVVKVSSRMINVDPLVIMMFGRMRRCQNDKHVDCKCQKDNFD